MAAAVIIGMPLWFAGDGLKSYFTGDDLMNLYLVWTKPWQELLVANASYWSPFYRPLGGLFYRGLYAGFGFDPAPFRVAAFLVLALNLGLVYAVARRLSTSREVAVLTCLAASFHGALTDLYYNTGTIYDILCFTFYLAGLLVYMRERERGAGLRWPAVFGMAVLYICALNAKEMAVTLPLTLLCYELLYHGWREAGAWRSLAGRVWVAGLLGAVTVPYVVGKLSHKSPFFGSSEYTPDISVARYFDSYRRYLAMLFYQQPGWLSLAGFLALLLALLVIAWRSKRRELWFGAIFVSFSVLPVIFITMRGTAFLLYIPYFGWCLLAASLLTLFRQTVARGGAGLTFLVVAVGLFYAHWAHHHHDRLGMENSAMARQIHAGAPRPRAGCRMLFLNDPYPADTWDLLFLVRLSYGDPTIQVSRAKTMTPPLVAKDWDKYDFVFDYQDARFGLVIP